MMTTTDPALRSWVESANVADCDFPIQNLPYGVFCRKGEDPWDDARVGVAIGDMVLDLDLCAEAGLFEALDTEDEPIAYEFAGLGLNGLMLAPKSRRIAIRTRIQELLSESCDELRESGELRDEALVALDAIDMLMPAEIADYTDFYASVHHATNVGTMFRPTNPLLPNYKHIPIGYHGRASSLTISGTEVKRPNGQKAPAEEGGAPTRSASALLDYELEVGMFVAEGNELGTTIPIADAADKIFGLCLLNDWSARDLQKWEYQPLGPFLAKSFASTISPWVVPMEALEPFRCAAYARPEGDPAPMDYLHDEDDQARGGIDITLEIWLSSAKMREAGNDAIMLSRGRFNEMYWTFAQMLAHHASNGCNMQAGDLLGSGTVSGTDRSERGSLLELTWDGSADNPVPGTQRTPIVLPTGEERKFLADGDEVTIRGYCTKPGQPRIGFGSCSGIITPADPI